MKKITGLSGYINEGIDEILFVNEEFTPNKFYSYKIEKGLTEITKEEYKLRTIGINYVKIDSILNSSIENYNYTKGLNGDLYFSFYQEEEIIGFDQNGNKNFEWLDKIGNGHSIYDIEFQPPNYMWLAYPTGQTVSQIDLNTGKEMYRIGDYTHDDIYEPLNFPESISIEKETLYIPNMGSKKLLELNLKSHELKEMKIFEEKIWQYLKTKIGDFVLLDSGIYKI